MYIKKIWYLIMMLFTACATGTKSTEQANMEDTLTDPPLSFYSLKATTIDGKEVAMEQYKGKKLLIVNTASECGYTPQYEELQKLHENYGDKVTVIGFPCNQFGGQEPGQNADIQLFCKKNYGVTFQLFEKTDVKGANAHPIYKWLTTKTQNGWNDQAPSWNFCKYLIDADGKLVKYFPASVSPLSNQVLSSL